MAVPLLDRARIILDLLKDGDTVAGDAAYTGLDMIGAAAADKYLEPLYENHTWLQQVDGNGDKIAYASLTNNQKAVVLMNFLRRTLRWERERWKASIDGQTAYNNSKATIESDADTDLGAEE